MRILFVGDIVGKPGRKAVKALLPDLRKEFDVDLVVANVDNLAHGKGVTRPTFEEMRRAGVDVATSGNHVWSKDKVVGLLNDPDVPLIRPANYPPGSPGRGSRILEVGTRRLLLIHLQGRVFMGEDLDDPFRILDGILNENSSADIGGILVDLHAEATSEKIAFGWYADGRVSAVIGTHTHVATADAWILPGGTAYVTDVGMTGPKHSVIGVERKIVIDRFLTQRPIRFEVPESGPVLFSSVLITIDPATRKATATERVDREFSA